MTTSTFGSSIKRREDPKLITGLGTYTDDINLPNMLHAAIVRSPHAHASIRNIDTSRAKNHPGVVAVSTGAELQHQLGSPSPLGGSCQARSMFHMLPWLLIRHDSWVRP